MPPWPDTYPLSFFAPLAPPRFMSAAISPLNHADSTRSTTARDVHPHLPAGTAALGIPTSTAPPAFVPPATFPPPPSPRPDSSPPAPSRQPDAQRLQRPVASAFFGEQAGDGPHRLGAAAATSLTASSSPAQRLQQHASGEPTRDVARRGEEDGNAVERGARSARARSPRRKSDPRRDSSVRWAPSAVSRSSHLYEDDLGPCTFAPSFAGLGEPRYAPPSAHDHGRPHSPRRRTRSPSPPARRGSRLEAVEPRRTSVRSMPPAFVDRPASARSECAPGPVSAPSGPSYAQPRDEPSTAPVGVDPPSSSTRSRRQGAGSRLRRLEKKRARAASRDDDELDPSGSTSARASHDGPLRRLDGNVDELRDAKRPRVEQAAAAARTSPAPSPQPRHDAPAPLPDSSRVAQGGMSLSDRWDALEEGRGQRVSAGTGGRRRRGGRKEARRLAAAAAARGWDDGGGGDGDAPARPSSREDRGTGRRPSVDDLDGLVFDFAAEPPRRPSGTPPLVTPHQLPPSKRTSSPRNGPRWAEPRRTRSSNGGAPAPPPERTLRDSDLSPSIAVLRERDFKRFVLKRPVEPTWSLPLYLLILKLLTSIAPPELWAPDAASLGASPPSLEPDWLATSVIGRQPDKAEVRAACGGSPGRGLGFASLSRAVHERYLAMVDVVRWLFEDRSLGESETAYVMLHAPREVRILVSRFAEVVLFSELVQRHERTLVTYLARLPSPSPRQRASLTLLEWLNTTAQPDRHYLFLSEPDGRLRGEKTGVEPWRWWFARAEAGRSTAVEVLDDWERDTLSMEQW
ncbi:uncharacterized protein RHOBADRAFT_55862 [Rhodotorula graminis WP1]|uniref:Proteophosphoglycan ppg4 n=1 Tax=Rhodotorula graminis (strain WP1) TaxID=578459 RepID=A0A0P9ET02_RHOGW|nr:uncharacterized protein RHOBADRAFT_55862 [Rhodotorula graminis WP1]KPV72393.1 hypothetical protein RHOBADRAFT_55862 [Rhodotorula graminis WP1]